MTIIKLASNEEYASVSSFINEYWKKNHAYVESKSLFDWTFLNNPNWLSSNYSISIALNNGAIDGMLGTIPFELNIYGKSFKACWLVNWLLLPHARKGRTGLKLLNIFSKNLKYDTISFGINDTVARLYSSLKWQEMPTMPRMVWINPDFSSDAEILLAKLYPNAGNDLIVRFVQSHSTEFKTINNPAFDSFESINEKTWNKRGWDNLKVKTIGCSRDSKYLIWRYLEHPIYKYNSIVVDDGINVGLLIWRLDKASNFAHANLSSDSYQFARIVEFLPNSEFNALKLLSIFIQCMKESGIQAADFYCYNKEICNLISKMGFMVMRETTGIQFPNYTQPLSVGSPIRSATKLNDSYASVGSSGDWYWTKSDSDQDRPN
jgi:hypothetical protein